MTDSLEVESPYSDRLDRLERWWTVVRVRNNLELLVDYGQRCTRLAARGEATIRNDSDLCAAAHLYVERIGETANRLPAEFRADFPDVPWKSVVGMRVRLAHHYEAVDDNVVLNALFGFVPELFALMGLDLTEP